MPTTDVESLFTIGVLNVQRFNNTINSMGLCNPNNFNVIKDALQTVEILRPDIVDVLSEHQTCKDCLFVACKNADVSNCNDICFM